MKAYEVEIRETFVYTVRIEAVNEAAAANTAFSLEWITADDEVEVVKQTATLTKIKETR